MRPKVTIRASGCLPALRFQPPMLGQGCPLRPGLAGAYPPDVPSVGGSEPVAWGWGYHDLEVGVGGPPRLPTLLPAGLEEVPRGCRNKTLLPKSGDHVAALPGAGLWASGCSHRPPPQEGLLFGDRKARTSRTAQQAGSGLPGTCMSRLPRPWPP